MTAQTMLAEAASWLGYVQHGDTPFGDWYGARHNDPGDDAADWCAMAVSYWAWKTGQGDAVGEFAWVPSFVESFKDRGQFGQTPRVGAIIFMDFIEGPSGDGSHVGIVEVVHSDGSVGTIEGNTGTPGQVARRTRSGDIVGYGYPAYPTTQEDDVPKYSSVALAGNGSAASPATMHVTTINQDDTGSLETGNPSIVIDAGKTTQFATTIWPVGTGRVRLVEVDPVHYQVTKEYCWHGAGASITEVGDVSPDQHLWVQTDGAVTATAKVQSWPGA